MDVAAQKITDRYALYNGDCVDVMGGMQDGALHLSVYSPPFCGLYHYSSSDRDLSNSRGYDEFFEHYEFVAKEIARVTMAGRMTGVHCIDTPMGNATCNHLRDFPGDIIRMHERLGFHYVGRYCVWKEPYRVRIRTMAKGLAHQSLIDDASRITVASADYLLMFQKHGDTPVKIEHPEGLTEYAGSRQMPANILKYRAWKGPQVENKYSQWIWRRYASAFWDDVRVDNVLPFKDSRDEDDEKHVHPLQLDIIERCVQLWSNPEETVFTPFMGVGSEVFGAVLNGRRGVGVELKESYYRQALLNVEEAVKGRAGDQSRLNFEHADGREDDGEGPAEFPVGVGSRGPGGAGAEYPVNALKRS